MPTYEYQCLSCGRHVEVVQRFSDEPLRTCESCGGPLRRVFHPVGIVLKGSGFYSTDNRGGPKHRPADTKEPAAETTGSETKKDSKPAAESTSSTSSSTDSASSSKKKK